MSIGIFTGRDLVELERMRLIKLRQSDPGWWKTKGRSNWARKRFGETLTENEGVVWGINGDVVNNHVCEVCGRLPEMDEPFVRFNLSSLEDEGAGWFHVCKTCLYVAKDRLEERLVVKEESK